MSVYVLLQGATATNGPFSPSSPPASPSLVVKPTGPNHSPNINPTQQTVQGIVTGTGSVSATIKVMGSNDGGVTWVDAVATVTISSGTGFSTAGSTSNLSYAYYTAYLSAVSGTNATVQALMGC